jgi:hypothetical protein
MSTCHTADEIDHGESTISYCFEAMIEKFEDGYILCPILWSGGKCEECLEAFERREARNNA